MTERGIIIRTTRRVRVETEEAAGADEPCYVISVASRMVGVHAQTLRSYERLGLLEPARSRGNVRLFSPADVSRARWIKSLMDDFGVNLAGVAAFIAMQSRIAELEREVRNLQKRLSAANAPRAGR